MSDDLREALAASFNAAPELPQGAQLQDQSQPDDKSLIQSEMQPEARQTEVQRARDEQGRFAAKQNQEESSAAKAQGDQALQQGAEDVANQAKTESPETPAQAPTLNYPTTWRKDAQELLQQAASALPPEQAKKFVDYLHQREEEYKTGVATYRAEALQAKHLTDAIAPFMAEIQRHGAEPAQWLSNLGNTHYALINGTPQQKLEVFSKLAHDYQVPLQGVAQAEQGQYDPFLIQQMQQQAELVERITSLQQWQQQQEAQAIQQKIDSYRANQQYPHFDAVAQDMARMIETGFAKSIEEAYPLAVRMRNDLAGTTSSTAQQAAQQNTATQAPPIVQPQASKQEIAAKARAQAISPKSGAKVASPPVNPKDLRGQLAAQFDAVADGRF